MTTPIPLFVELCAGTAALSLRLHRDGAKPPVSRMGAKTGYSSAILRILGLAPGQRAAAYLWCEPDPGVRLLLHAYRDAGLAKAAAAIIRSWAAEDPRALWERLRAEGPPRLPDGAVDAGEVARFIVDTCTSIGHMAGEGGFAAGQIGDGSPNNPRRPREMPYIAAACDRLPTIDSATITPDARHIDPREVARWAQITASNRLINTAWSDTEGRWVNTGDGGATFGGAAFCSPPERTAEGMEAAPGDVPAVVVPDAREVDPREVARHLCGSFLSYGQKPGTGFRASAGGLWPDTPPDVTTQADRLEALPRLHAALIHPDAREVDPREVARLLYMAPVAARPDGVDVRDGHPVASGNDLAGLYAGADRSDVVLGQDCGRMLDADLGGPVGDLVADVDCLGGPCEVLGPVVVAPAIEVTGHHAARTGAVEGGADQRTDAPIDAPAAGAHHELLIPVLAQPARQGPVGVDGPDQAGVADGVLGSLCYGSPFDHMDTSTDTIPYGSAGVQLPPGTICYMDPSYVGTTGYADNLGRAEVVALARRWAAAGAVVCISEAEPIPELVAEGWHAVEITGERVGQARTFSRQKREWLTLNTAPAWVPSVQGSLF